MKKVIEAEPVQEDSGFVFDWKHWIFLAMIVLVVGVVWFWIYGYEECKDSVCFYEAMKGCDRVTYVGGEDMIFEYKIKGESEDACEVSVKLLQANLNSVESEKLEGRSMDCLLPLGVAIAPESDVGNCHGRLKEELQSLIIEKLQNYLVDNLGKLNFESGLPGSLGI